MRVEQTREWLPGKNPKEVGSEKTSNPFAIGRGIRLEADSKEENFILPHLPFFIEQSDKNIIMSVPAIQPQWHYIAVRIT